MDASAITLAAATRLGQYLRVSRCAYADVEADEDTFNLTGNYTDGVAGIVGRYRFTDFGAECLRQMRAGEPYIVEDSETDPRTAQVIESYRATAIRSVICVSLLKAGRFVAAMAVHQDKPRRWTSEEVELLRLVASRCWESIERARVDRELQQLNEALEYTVQQRTDALLRSERQFSRLVAGVTDCAIYMLDATGCVTSWNPGAERIKGYTANEIIGHHFSEFYTPEDRAAGVPDRTIASVAATGKFEGEGWRVRKDGTRFWASVLMDPIYDSGCGTGRTIAGYAKITRDMTERRAMQEQLHQSQKMEAIGQLTGGVAHDFNNLLTIILGNLDTISRRASLDAARVDRSVEHALCGAQRAAALTQQLLAFSRRQPLNPKPTDVNRLVGGMANLIGRTVSETIAVETSAADSDLWVEVDTNQLESALLNLAINARDAMPDGGVLTMQTSSLSVDAEYARRFTGMNVGPYVVISLTDSGKGMSSEVMSRAFDPFFTTKPIGQGTGLGLSQVFGFVTQSGGQIKLDSEVGRGTTVRIFLPQFTGDRCETHDATVTALPRAAAGETILVVEDEADVRTYSVESLLDLGFRVLQARDGPSALQTLAEHPEVQLLFTDVGLPGMNGRELVEHAHALRPELPVLFTTGYARDVIVHEGRLDPGVELLAKPFSRTQLAARVREVLDTNARLS